MIVVSTTSQAAVDMLRKHALAEKINLREQGEAIGLKPHAMTARYKKSDMKLSEFYVLAKSLGTNPIKLLQQAEQQTEMASAGTEASVN